MPNPLGLSGEPVEGSSSSHIDGYRSLFAYFGLGKRIGRCNSENAGCHHTQKV